MPADTPSQPAKLTNLNSSGRSDCPKHYYDLLAVVVVATNERTNKRTAEGQEDRVVSIPDLNAHIPEALQLDRGISRSYFAVFDGRKFNQEYIYVMTYSVYMIRVCWNLQFLQSTATAGL